MNLTDQDFLSFIISYLNVYIYIKRQIKFSVLLIIKYIDCFELVIRERRGIKLSLNNKNTTSHHQIAFYV